MSFKLEMDGDSWESFCERMLCHEFGWKSFTPVPHQDRGDHGIEFFTNCGVIFQCYYPDPQYSMAEYKKHVQKKINDDLKKLEKNEIEIKKMLGDIEISLWVLVIPEIRTRDLLKYCKTKEKAIPTLSFESKSGIKVKVVTDDTYPTGSLYSRKYIGKEINVDVQEVREEIAESWRSENSQFFKNICRKTNKIATTDLNILRNKLIQQYMQVEELMDAYREQFPDLYIEITSIAINNLEALGNDNLFMPDEPKNILLSLLKKNRESLKLIEQSISNNNIEVFSSGLLAKWLAECKMDFMLNE